ncbi:MAG: hypothetical protein Q8J64_06625 [Thermodesulfovibrionales bacterium]|nr:hypothetical protein [Thermodesulfovibrionales bacterium]
MSLLEKLKAGMRNERTIKFPGTEQEIVLRILSEAGRQAAAFDTEYFFKKKGIEYSAATVEAYEGDRTIRLIFSAFRDAEGNPLAKTVDELKALLTMAEKDILVEEYLSFERECSSNLSDMSAEEIDTLLDVLKKNPLETILNGLNIVTARKLILSLASRLANLQTDNGSTS